MCCNNKGLKIFSAIFLKYLICEIILYLIINPTNSQSGLGVQKRKESPEIYEDISLPSLDFLRQILVPLKSSPATGSLSGECSGVETFEKVNGVDLSPLERIPLFSSSNGAITADCYNRCRSSSSCLAFWIDYNTSSCFRLGSAKYTDSNIEVDFTKSSTYFERLCLQGDVCSKAWVSERVPGYELSGYDDVIIRSVSSRKRCTELCLTDKRLPCRSADFWESRKECRLSREDRRSQPGAFVKSSSEVEYIENTCTEPIASSKGRECEWQIMKGVEFGIYDFTSKAESLLECQKSCETYGAFTCRSITYDSLTGVCLLSGSDMATTSSKLLRVRENKIYAQRVICIDMTLECNGESMVAKLKSHSPFYGKLFATSFSSDCEVFGHGKLLTSIEYPLNSCGVYKDVDGSLVGTLIVQQHPLIQKRGDSAFRLVCTFPEINRTLAHTVGFERESESRLIESSALPTPLLGIATSVINSSAKSPTVNLRIMDKNGNDITGVSLGDELFLKIEVEATSAYGVFARDLVAKSGTNEDELILLDSRGCPEDPAIFPHLKKEADDSKSLKSRFEAFKFTNDAVVRFQVYLQFCRHECPPIRCDGELSFGRKKRSKDEELDFVELQKEIIVRGPSSNNRIKNNLDKTIFEDPSGALGSQFKNINEICGNKNLIISLIIGFCIVQILIVFCSAICFCQKSKDKLINEPSTLRSSDLYYARPSNVFGTLGSIRTNLRD